MKRCLRPIVGAARSDAAGTFARDAVSHHHVALQRADQIVVLADGHVVDVGCLDELLLRCEETRHLWADA